MVPIIQFIQNLYFSFPPVRWLDKIFDGDPYLSSLVRMVVYFTLFVVLIRTVVSPISVHSGFLVVVGTFLAISPLLFYLSCRNKRDQEQIEKFTKRAKENKRLGIKKQF